MSSSPHHLLRAASVPRLSATSLHVLRRIGDPSAVPSVSRAAIHAALDPVRVESLAGYGLGDFDFWRAALATAHAAEWLGARHGLDPTAMYVAGLLLDVGKIVLEPHLGDTLRHTDEPPTLAERTATGTDHAIVGAALLQTWGVPEPIIACVRYHHDPASATTEPIAVACAHVAAWSTQWLGHPAALGALREPLDQAVVDQLDIDEDDLRQLALAVARGLNSEPRGTL